MRATLGQRAQRSRCSFSPMFTFFFLFPLENVGWILPCFPSLNGGAGTAQSRGAQGGHTLASQPRVPVEGRGGEDTCGGRWPWRGAPAGPVTDQGVSPRNPRLAALRRVTSPQTGPSCSSRPPEAGEAPPSSPAPSCGRSVRPGLSPDVESGLPAGSACPGLRSGMGRAADWPRLWPGRLLGAWPAGQVAGFGLMLSLLCYKTTHSS